jgi:hypothetical protein
MVLFRLQLHSWMSCLGSNMPRMMAGFSAGGYILGGIRVSLSEQRNIRRC